MPPDPPAKGPRRALRIGKYEVLAHIASGGMGAVYRARDRETGREVALKVLTPEMAAKPAMLERFRREARHAARLRHENIVTLYEFDHAKGTYYLAMEFVDGIDLHEYSQRKGPLDPEEARQIILQACRALRHAHEQGIVHRDIKPSNFLVTRQEGRLLVKLTDLGLAREADTGEFRVTRAGTTVGTLDYMAPEQARDSGAADIRSDLYALGSTWYHLLAGQPPFPKGGLGERLYKLMSEDPADVRQFNPRVAAGTVRVLNRLLAKEPSDRYQTPAELLEDLDALGDGGRPAPRRDVLPSLTLGEADVPRRPPSSRSLPKPRPRSGAVGKSSGPRPAADTDVDRPKTVEDRAPRSVRWYVLGGAAVALLFGVGLALEVLHGRHDAPSPAEQGKAAPPAIEPAPAPPRLEPRPPAAADVGAQAAAVAPAPAAPVKPRWPALYRPAEPIDAARLRREVEAPWSHPAAAPAGPTLPVGRAGAAGAPVYPSLAAACAAAPPGQVSVLEVRDNGPLFETPVAVAGRGLVIRAAPGYRPLLVWDVQRTLDERRRERRKENTGEANPLVFVDVAGGSLTLEGVDVAVKWPDAVAEGSTLLQVKDGDLTATDCTFSLTGQPHGGAVLARLRGQAGPEAGRCRFTRCYSRGGALAALELDVAGGEALFDGCLLAGGEAPLLQVRAGDEGGATLRVVRSTLVCGRTLLGIQPAQPTDRNPAVRWFGWDSLLSRSSAQAGGDLVSLPAGAGPGGMKWDACNCLYAGWDNLLTGAVRIPADDLSSWRRQWNRIEGDAVVRDRWPAAVSTAPAELAAGHFRTAETPVGFAASVAADKPLGCDLDALPAVRENWGALTYDRFAALAPEAITDAAAPAIPDPGDGLYHGERLDLDQVHDPGAHLRQVQRRWKLGPRVVLHLAGKGEKPVTPIRVKGSTLVLYFEPPADEEAQPLALTFPARERAGQDALIEVEGGGLEVIGGELRLPEGSRAQVPPFLLKVRGGDLRLYRCRLEGPQLTVPDAFRGLVFLAGSGRPEAEHSFACAVNECVLVSGRAGVRVEGIGARLLLRQSLVAAGGEAVQLVPGAACRERANVQCLLERVTVAARQAVVHLGDTSYAGVPREPVVIQSHDSAFLNPFAGKPNRAGLLLYDGEALSRGLLVWQGEGDVFDRRLYFGARGARAALPDKPEGHAAWARLWGSYGVRRPVLDLPLARVIEPGRWQLDRLALPAGRGADLALLGIKKPAKPAR